MGFNEKGDVTWISATNPSDFETAADERCQEKTGGRVLTAEEFRFVMSKIGYGHKAFSSNDYTDQVYTSDGCLSITADLSIITCSRGPALYMCTESFTQ